MTNGSRYPRRVARAEIDDGSQRVIVRAGEMVTLAAPGARAQFQAFNTARWDSFSQWANERSNGFADVCLRRAPALRSYGFTAARSIKTGVGNTSNPYGYVWYPAVGVAWRPYYNGWWAHTRYGWTWRGHDRWSWPTHHYGRWGFNGASWYWIPSVGWGPAWVSWGVSAGYVSWAPLGWNGSPAIGFWARRDHPAYAPRYDPWRGWTVVPRDQFGPRRAVRPRAIDGNRLDDGVRSAMILQNHGPAYAGSAVPRQSFTVATGAGNTRRDDPRIDRPGSVRRPQGAATTPTATPPPGGVPQRRITDAPAYAPVAPAAPVPTAEPIYSVPRVGSAERNRGNGDTDRGGRVRATDPRPAERDGERPVVTSAGSPGDDDANRARPRGGVVDRSPRSGTPSTQDSAGGSDNRGGSTTRGGYVRGGGSQGGGSQGGGSQGSGSQAGSSQGGRSGGSDAGARPRGGVSSGGASSGGNSGGSTGARPGGGGGAVRPPR